MSSSGKGKAAAAKSAAAKTGSGKAGTAGAASAATVRTAPEVLAAVAEAGEGDAAEAAVGMGLFEAGLLGRPVFCLLSLSLSPCYPPSDQPQLVHLSPPPPSRLTTNRAAPAAPTRAPEAVCFGSGAGAR